MRERACEVRRSSLTSLFDEFFEVRAVTMRALLPFEGMAFCRATGTIFPFFFGETVFAAVFLGEVRPAFLDEASPGGAVKTHKMIRDSNPLRILCMVKLLSKIYQVYKKRRMTKMEKM